MNVNTEQAVKFVSIYVKFAQVLEAQQQSTKKQK